MTNGAKITMVLNVPDGTPTKEVINALLQALKNHRSWVFGNSTFSQGKREAYQEAIDLLEHVNFLPRGE